MGLKSGFVVSALLALASAADDADTINEKSSDFKFMEFVSKYGKQYASKAEFMLRKELFLVVDKEIQMLNLFSSQDNRSSYSAGHNLFSDMTVDERDRMGSMNEYIPTHDFKTPEVYRNKNTYNLPSEWDWRSQGKVTPVRQ